MAISDSNPVKKVRQALKAAGLDDKVVELSAAMETASAIAKELDTEPGAILQTLIYAIDKRMVMVLVAGDHKPVEGNLGAAFFLEGDVRKPDNSEVSGLLGFAADCVPPLGLDHPLPVVIDRSVKRFKHLYASAGDPQCVFRISVAELKRKTGGIISWNIAEPADGAGGEIEQPPRARTKTFTGERKVDGVEV